MIHIMYVHICIMHFPQIDRLKSDVSDSIWFPHTQLAINFLLFFWGQQIKTSWTIATHNTFALSSESGH